MLEISILIFSVIIIYALLYKEKNSNNNTDQELKKLLENHLEEMNKKKEVISNKVNSFLEQSLQIEKIAIYQSKSIYKYILNKNGSLYEFEDLSSPNNYKIGVDDNLLCFKQLIYKRIPIPFDFFDKYIIQKINSQDISIQEIPAENFIKSS